jgi:acetyl-CoA acetyltransferase
MSETVHVIGVGRTDFKRNLRKENKGLRDVIVEAGKAALADAGIDPAEVQAGFVGNFAAGLYTRQLHLGSFLTDIDPKLRGIATLHTEAACASGSVAVVTAAKLVQAGVHDVMIVVGAEQQKTMSPAEGADVLAAAGDWTNEKPRFGEHMFPKLFAHIASIYNQKYGVTEKQLALVSVKNYAHAKRNPLAQMRDNPLTMEYATSESEKNPRFAPPLKITDCSQITDGAAAIVLCSGRALKKLGKKGIRMLGYGHTTDHLELARKDIPTFSTARAAVQRAYDMARLTPRDVSCVEVHDCFSISEICAYEFLGLADNGMGAKFVETGATMLPALAAEMGLKPSRSVPVNTGGGLIGDGHPVGATGVRQVVEAYTQLLERGGDRQVPGAKNAFTFNMGGSFTTAVAMLWAKD